MNEKKRGGGRFIVRMTIVVTLALVTFCIGCFALALISNADPEVQATRTARAIAQATSAIETSTAEAIIAQTETARPTDVPTLTTVPTIPPTQEPTATPKPTATPHIAPLYPTIAAEYNEMTEVQQDRYLDSLVGAEIIEWTGVVREVSESLGKFNVAVDSGRESLTFDVYLQDIPEDVAVDLNLDDLITFSGRFNSWSRFLGLTIYVNNVTVHNTED